MIKPVIGRPPEAIELGVELLKSNPSGCFGPWLMALVGTSFMLGIMVTQATKYFSAFGYESRRIFTIVISCIILSISSNPRRSSSIARLQLRRLEVGQLLRLFAVVPALCISLVTDLLITGLTLWKLGRRGKSFSPNTDSILHRLRNVTIEAAAPPAIAAFFNFVLCFRWRNFSYHWFGLMAPKLYVWSLMFTLNSRVAIREQFNSPNEDQDRSEPLSTGFEFARFSRLNRKFTHPDSGPDRATFVLSALSRPLPVSGTSTGMTEEESSKREVQDEMLRSKDSINSNSNASKNRREFDLDHPNAFRVQTKADNGSAAPLSLAAIKLRIEGTIRKGNSTR
ncbi:hypothetical protein M407DRAFT_4061 [Tulasnella calospora MUT 4182]|uniref:DUF6534 domain-containing protein n=1 Tax=Tulasnella calospora MUT 4182 TaxID=1051891 RepID=A0A0C3QUY8_9AGAM|nr:hypothetical protein M407DRAFT_4061 [Tulasnella calospora MUT 4182]